MHPRRLFRARSTRRTPFGHPVPGCWSHRRHLFLILVALDARSRALGTGERHADVLDEVTQSSSWFRCRRGCGLLRPHAFAVVVHELFIERIERLLGVRRLESDHDARMCAVESQTLRWAVCLFSKCFPFASLHFLRLLNIASKSEEALSFPRRRENGCNPFQRISLCPAPLGGARRLLERIRRHPKDKVHVRHRHAQNRPHHNLYRRVPERIPQRPRIRQRVIPRQLHDELIQHLRLSSRV